MGCDIHAAIEEQPYEAQPTYFGTVAILGYLERDYLMFTLMAQGVRGELDAGREIRGLPPNVCGRIGDWVERYGDDGHSHSWMTLSEFESVLADYARLSRVTPGRTREIDVSYKRILEIMKLSKNPRLVFFFDN